MIELNGTGKLTAPVIVAAFEGWNDAGEAASGVITHLESRMAGEPVGSIDPEDYYDFQVTRPVTEMTDGSTQRLVWPTTRLLTPAKKPTDRDIVLVHGIEPNMRWRGFCAELVGAFADLKRRDGGAARRAAGRLAAHPAGAGDHRLPPTRSWPPGCAPRPSTTRARPGSSACCSTSAPRPASRRVSLWAAVPHYVAQPPSPKATLALLRGVEDVLDIALPLADLAEKARAWERGVDELAEQDTEVADYVRTLEEAQDATELPEASGDAIAREFERYLRRRRDRGDRGGRCAERPVPGPPGRRAKAQ